MEYKTVKFWEDILDQFEKDATSTGLCDVEKFRKCIWTDDITRSWCILKAKEFINLSRKKDLYTGHFFLFIYNYCADRNIRIEFLK